MIGKSGPRKVSTCGSASGGSEEVHSETDMAQPERMCACSVLTEVLDSFPRTRPDPVEWIGARLGGPSGRISPSWCAWGGYHGQHVTASGCEHDGLHCGSVYGSSIRVQLRSMPT